jgi:hypothetical protein
MQKLQGCFLVVLTFLGFCILGFGIGYIAGYAFTRVANVGMLTSWQTFDSQIKFKHIEEATSQMVWARATDDKLYVWDTNCYREPNCEKWVEVIEVPENIHGNGKRPGEMPVERSKDCQSEPFLPSKLPGNVVECVRTRLAELDFGAVTYYALMEDGKIMVRHQNSSMIFDIPAYCAIGGLVLGVISFIIFMIVRFVRRKQTSPSYPPLATTII